MLRRPRRRYERLSRVAPEHDAYKLAWAQALHKCGEYEAAERIAVRVAEPTLQRHVATLLAVGAYERDDLPGEPDAVRPAMRLVAPW